MKKWVIRIVASLLLFLLLVYSSYLILFTYVRVKIQDALAERLHARVRIETFDFSWNEGSLFVKGVRVKDLLGQPNFAMTIEQVDVYLEPKDLWKKPLVIQAMAYRNPVLQVSLPSTSSRYIKGVINNIYKSLTVTDGQDTDGQTRDAPFIEVFQIDEFKIFLSQGLDQDTLDIGTLNIFIDFTESFENLNLQANGTLLNSPIKVSGSYSVTPLDIQFSFVSKDMDAGPLAIYLASFLPVQVNFDKFSIDSTVTWNDDQKDISGSFAMKKCSLFYYNETPFSKERWDIAVDKIKTRNILFSFNTGNFHLGKTTLHQPILTYTIDPQPNLPKEIEIEDEQYAGQRPTPIWMQNLHKMLVGTPEKKDMKSPKWDIESVVISLGSFTFYDHTPSVPFKFFLDQIGLNWMSIGNKTPEGGTIQFKSRVDSFGLLNAGGRINPFSDPAALAFSIHLSGYDVRALNPYFADNLEIQAIKGILYTIMNTEWKDETLFIHNFLTIDDLVAIGIDEETGSSTATALMQLRNRKGEVHLQIQASLDSEGFHFNPWVAIRRALRNVTGKAVASPLTLATIPSKFLKKTKSQIIYLPFAPNVSDIDPGMIPNLQNLAERLRKKKAEKVDLQGFFYPDFDNDNFKNLQRKRSEAIKAYLISKEEVGAHRIFIVEPELDESKPLDSIRISIHR